MNFLKGLGLAVVLMAAVAIIQGIGDAAGYGYGWNPYMVPGFIVLGVLCWIGVELSAISTQLRWNAEREDSQA